MVPLGSTGLPIFSLGYSLEKRYIPENRFDHAPKSFLASRLKLGKIPTQSARPNPDQLHHIDE